MANKDGSGSAVGTSLPLLVFLLTACTVPETEGAVDAPSADLAQVEPVVTELARRPHRSDGASSWLEHERSERLTSTAVGTSDIQAMIATEAVRRGGVPPALALAVAKVGSDVASSALGAAGTVGTMQIAPALADEFDLDVDDLHEAASNIRAGIACLAALHERYGGDWQLALSHFRGGPLKEAGRTFAPHSFTRRYVRDVLRWWRFYRHDPLTGAWLRKVQGLPRFVSGSSVPGNTPVVVAAAPASGHAGVGGRWQAVGGGRRFR